MREGYLSEYFQGVAAKTLSVVETDRTRSHQHEFNGTTALRRIFGETDEVLSFPATFMYLDDLSDESDIVDGSLTWYDSRRNVPTRSAEYRMYYAPNPVMDRAVAGDLLVLGLLRGGRVLVLVAQAGSTISNQIQWMFGVRAEAGTGFSIRAELDEERDRIAFTSRFILESIGIVVETDGEAWLDRILERFGPAFPTTKEFSAFARSTLPEIDARDDADGAVMAWMEREEALFRVLEKHIVAERLRTGFEDDVDGFISYSLSVQNRRKSRVGHAFENHLERAFAANGLRFDRGAYTEAKSKPDFLFPGAAEYRDPAFNADLLTMLGVKSTCKDRWRQVLAEADRIPHKHLLTLEASISSTQTAEMRAKSLQLVIPRAIHSSYKEPWMSWLMDIDSFVREVGKKQEAS